MTTTQSVLAQFITDTSATSIEPLAMERSRATIADCVGVALAGSRTPIARAIYSFLRACDDLRTDSGAILLGCAERASTANAALYNGTIAHALDFDDGTRPGNLHITANLVPTIMSVTSADDLFNEDFRCAYVIGFEVAAKLGRVLTRDKRGPSWHPTGVIGPIGSAAAAAKALSLDSVATAHALGMAASCSAGIRANFGTMTKPLHCGRAAQAGVMAALLAREGFESSADAFDGETGFFRTFGISAPDVIAEDVKRALAMLGNPWEISTDMGILMKPYPSCAQTHPAIEAALLAGRKVDVDSIKSIYVGVSAATLKALTYHRPDTGTQGKFSMEYCVATAIIQGVVNMDSFTDDSVRDAKVRELMNRISVEVDEGITNTIEAGATVEVVTESGDRVREVVESPKGNGARWLSLDERRSKFEDTAGRTLPSDRARSLFAMLSSDKLDVGEARDVLEIITSARVS